MGDRAVVHIAALALGAVVLHGCTTPVYGPISAENGGLGYRDMRNSDGSHTIRVVARTPAQAHEYWDRRAVELCGGPTYRKNIFRAEIPVVTQSGYATGANGYGGAYTQDVYGALVMEGYLRCGGDAAQETPTAPQPETP
jgi:hypothetical protein